MCLCLNAISQSKTHLVNDSLPEMHRFMAAKYVMSVYALEYPCPWGLFIADLIHPSQSKKYHVAEIRYNFQKHAL